MTADSPPATSCSPPPTGWGRVGRFVLLPGRRSPGPRPLTSLLPLRTGSGAVVLGARSVPSGGYELHWAPYAGRWTPFATLVVTDEEADTQEISFDPALHPAPGLEQYAGVVRLREPSYVRARASR